MKVGRGSELPWERPAPLGATTAHLGATKPTWGRTTSPAKQQRRARARHTPPRPWRSPRAKGETMPPRAVAPEQEATPPKKQHHREAEDQHETEDQDAAEEAVEHLLEEDDGKVEDVPQVIPEGDKEVRLVREEDL